MFFGSVEHRSCRAHARCASTRKGGGRPSRGHRGTRQGRQAWPIVAHGDFRWRSSGPFTIITPMDRAELERLDRDALIRMAEEAGVSRPSILTRPELVDELLLRATPRRDDPTLRKGRE